MTPDEAHIVLASKYDEANRPTLVQILRAHATLWRNGSTPEHADYCEAAAARITELEEALAFYADFENHCDGPGDSRSEVYEDSGRRACIALGVRYTGDDLVNPRQET